jgi:hypothetical protein
MSTLSGHSTARRASLLALYKAMSPRADDEDDDIGLTPAELKELDDERAEAIHQGRADDHEFQRERGL